MDWNLNVTLTLALPLTPASILVLVLASNWHWLLWYLNVALALTSHYLLSLLCVENDQVDDEN